ncbi:MAG: hypothetical protein J7599_07570 [Niabella sp.]|nr:hypothetical protein [Niabella sp.]
MKTKEEQYKDYESIKAAMKEPSPYANKVAAGTKHKKYPSNYTKPKRRKK